MTTTEILMTDPTTDEGRGYWAERRRLEEWREREGSRYCARCGAPSPAEYNARPNCGCDRPLGSCFDLAARNQTALEV